ncbi:hypothetical protein SAMN05421741_1125 [Paenimyroides ummariense]|uniref:Uncharacterized protein n=1 Tax=Paenimyroides ummariense TaxID=913024 RepID=A0A1I5C9S3_9FLAO|nr:hypothetical protein [Paenimyroides ummariense]SFN83739.1 hypothetical protein SAMN05421741_1125 [Paenimyroides ummariense]
MQFHSKAQEQALMRLQVQHEIAVAGIKNNNQLTDEEKQIALKEEKDQFNQKKKGLQGSLFIG